MTGRISDYMTEQWLSMFTINDSYLALHYDNPDIAGAYSSEVFGGGYSRQKIQFSSPIGRVIWNEEPLTFSGLPSVTVSYLAVWDDLYDGNYLASIALLVPQRIQAGKQAVFGFQTVAISLD